MIKCAKSRDCHSLSPLFPPVKREEETLRRNEPHSGRRQWRERERGELLRPPQERWESQKGIHLGFGEGAATEMHSGSVYTFEESPSRRSSIRQKPANGRQPLLRAPRQ